MEINENNVNEYIQLLTDNLELVNRLSDKQVEMLIGYLESEILRKKEILKN